MLCVWLNEVEKEASFQFTGGWKHKTAVKSAFSPSRRSRIGDGARSASKRCYMLSELHVTGHPSNLCCMDEVMKKA